MMDACQQHFVRDVLAAAVTELFDSYGVGCEVFEGSAEDTASFAPELGSMVGFRGKNIRGGLAFVAPIDLIAELLPVPRSGDRDDRKLRDWSAEIANQLLGRLKNKLSKRSLNFDVGTPVCFTGKSIRLVFLPDAEGVSLSFRAAATTVRVHLDCTVASKLADADISDLRIAAEGDVLLF